MDAIIELVSRGSLVTRKTLLSAVAHLQRSQTRSATAVDILDDDMARASVIRGVLTEKCNRGEIPRAPHFAGLRAWAWDGIAADARAANDKRELFEEREPVPLSKHSLAALANTLKPSALAAVLFEVLYSLETAFWCVGFVHGALLPEAVLLAEDTTSLAKLSWRYTRGTTGGADNLTLGARVFVVPADAHGGRKVCIAGDLERARVWIVDPAGKHRPLIVAHRDNALQTIDTSRDVRSLGLSLLLAVLDLNAMERKLQSLAPREHDVFVHLVSLLGSMAALEFSLVQLADAFRDEPVVGQLRAIADDYFPEGPNVSIAAGAYYQAARALNALVKHSLDARMRARIIAESAAVFGYPISQTERTYTHSPSSRLNHVLFAPWSVPDGDASEAERTQTVQVAAVRPEDLLPDPWHMRAVSIKAGTKAGEVREGVSRASKFEAGLWLPVSWGNIPQ